MRWSFAHNALASGLSETGRQLGMDALPVDSLSWDSQALVPRSRCNFSVIPTALNHSIWSSLSSCSAAAACLPSSLICFSHPDVRFSISTTCSIDYKTITKSCVHGKPMPYNNSLYYLNSEISIKIKHINLSQNRESRWFRQKRWTLTEIPICYRQRDFIWWTIKVKKSTRVWHLTVDQFDNLVMSTLSLVPLAWQCRK